VHYSIIIEKCHQHDLDVGFCCSGLLGTRGLAWPKTTFRLCHTSPIPQISHQVTPGSSCAENGPSRTSFRNGGRHQIKRRRETARDQKTFSSMLQQLDRQIEEMCVCRGKILRRRLSL
jgi:hypothetical protein